MAAADYLFQVGRLDHVLSLSSLAICIASMMITPIVRKGYVDGVTITKKLVAIRN